MAVEHPPDATSKHAPQSSFRRQVCDFEELQQLFANWGGAFMQMSRGRFRGEIQVATGAGLRLFQVHANQSLLTRGSDSVAFMTFIPITARNEGTVWQGRRLSRGELIVKSPEVAYNNRTLRDTTIRALLVPIERFRAASRILTGDDAAERIDPWSAIRPHPEAMQRFQRSLEWLLATSASDPDILRGTRGPTLANGILRELISAFASPRQVGVPDLSPRSRTRLVQRATDLMQARLPQPLSAIDLCAELGVSDRTLRRAFHETHGMGPLAFFRVSRMHAIRGALKQARGGNRSVAEIVRAGGFSRLGAFAYEYRCRFGERPSETMGVRGMSC